MCADINRTASRTLNVLSPDRYFEHEIRMNKTVTIGKLFWTFFVVFVHFRFLKWCFGDIKDDIH